MIELTAIRLNMIHGQLLLQGPSGELKAFLELVSMAFKWVPSLERSLAPEKVKEVKDCVESWYKPV